MKSDYKIMGIPERGENIEVLKQQLGITDDDVFLDTEHRKNPMWTWKQTATLPMESDVTHRVIVQDDSILCEDFKEFCKYLIKRFPEDIIIPCNKYDTHLPSGVVFQPGYCPSGKAYIIPVEYIKPIIECQEKEFPDHRDDDNMICYWAHHNNVRVLSLNPSVVDVLGESTIGHNGKKAVSFCKHPLGKKWANATSKMLYSNRDWSEPNNIVTIKPVQVLPKDKDGSEDITFIIPNRGGKNIDFVCDRMREHYPFAKFIVVTQNDKKLFMRGQLCNIGAKLADSKYVCFMDNDVFFQKKVDLIDSLQSYKAIMPFVEITQVELLENGYKKTRTSRKSDNAKGGLTFMRRKDFFECKGFSNYYQGYGYEDNELDARLGGITEQPGVICHITHPKRSTKAMFTDGYINRDLYFTRNNRPTEGVNDTTCDIESDTTTDGVRNVVVSNINSWLEKQITESLSKVALKAQNSQPNTNLRELIYDVGVYDGQDSMFFLSQGYDVVGIDCDPRNYEVLDELEKQGATTIRLAIAEHEGIIDFYLSNRRVWSSCNPHIANREYDSVKIQVKCDTLQSIFDKYGVPLYCKIDIEGNDIIALRSLKDKPRYISCELACRGLDEKVKPLEIPEELFRLGYREFALIRQKDNNSAILPWKGISEWFAYDEIVAHITELHKTDKELWYDIYARLQKPQFEEGLHT